MRARRSSTIAWALALMISACGSPTAEDLTGGAGVPGASPSPGASAAPTTFPTLSAERTTGSRETSRYVAEADAACRRAREAGAVATKATQAISPGDPRAFDRAVEAYSALIAIHDVWMRELRALRPRGSARAVAAGLMDNVNARTVLLRRNQAALERRDAAASAVYLYDVYRLQAEARGLGTRFGFRVCGTGTPATIAG
jgi:hypothetical protein